MAQTSGVATAGGLAANEHMDLVERYSANNYAPLPVVIRRGEGAWVEDVNGKRYIDMLSAYSALNFGHSHPRIVKTFVEQSQRLTLTSRAFQNDQFGPFCKELATFCGQELVLPMNTGAEAVETAVKTARKWGYTVKGVEGDQAEIICCENNFHGRTITIISYSTDRQFRDGFGPFTPGFHVIPFGDSDALNSAITTNTVAFLVEPIQGEGGIVVPPEGYLSRCAQICRDQRVLFVADEVQTGFGRTGKVFACDYEEVKPDLLILGKALGGGMMPVSAVVGPKSVLGVFEPGDHGSTFGGNPLACAVARTALEVLIDERLPQRAAELGQVVLARLRRLRSAKIKEVRGRGLLIGIELHPDAGGAKKYCRLLMERGVLCKETVSHVIRLAPPLNIERRDLDWALDQVEQVLA